MSIDEWHDIIQHILFRNFVSFFFFFYHYYYLFIYYYYYSRGGTQLWVGYGCAARSFEHHPITKPEKTQICYLYQKPFVSLRALFKTNQCFLQCKFGCISTFWQPVDKPKDKFIGNYAFCKNATYIKTNFQIKKGPLQNLRARKSTLSGPHISVPTFPLSTPRVIIIFSELLFFLRREFSLLK